MEPRRMMGFDNPGDQKVPITVRDWSAMKLAIWRSKTGWEIAKREAEAILSGCTHAEGCPASRDETRPCISDLYEKAPQADGETDDEYAARAGVRVQEGCPDRERRMSALVVLNAARMFAPVDARRLSGEPYFAPSREGFSEVLSELSAAQVELEILRKALRDAGVPIPSPSAELTALLTERAPQQFEESPQ
jgi:hypothetical protein